MIQIRNMQNGRNSEKNVRNSTTCSKKGKNIEHVHLLKNGFRKSFL